MSVDHVKQVVGRALMDSNFRAQLFSDPKGALGGYDLTGEEFEALSNLTPEKLQGMQESLQQGLGGDVLSKIEVMGKHFDPSAQAMDLDNVKIQGGSDPAAASDYLLKLDGIKGESKGSPQGDQFLKIDYGDPNAAHDYLLKLDGIKGESSGAPDQFLKIQNVPGEHFDKGHSKHIEIESFSWGATDPPDPVKGDIQMKGSKIGQNFRGGGVLGILIGLLLFMFLLLFLFLSMPSTLIFSLFGGAGFDPASLGDGSVIPACDGSVMPVALMGEPPDDGSEAMGDGSVMPISDAQEGMLLPAVQKVRDSAARMNAIQTAFLYVNAFQMDMGQQPMMCKSGYSGSSAITAAPACGETCSTGEWCVASGPNGCAIYCQDADSNGTCEGYRCVDANNDHVCDLITWTTCSDSPPGVVCSPSAAPQGTCSSGLTCAPNDAGLYVCGGDACQPSDSACSPTTCGDQKCDPACENGTTCPKDCPTPTPVTGNTTGGGGTSGGNPTGGSQPTEEPGLCGDQGVSYQDRRCVCPGVIAVIYYCGTDPTQHLYTTNETCTPTESCQGEPPPDATTPAPACQCVYSDPCKNTTAIAAASCPGYYDSCTGAQCRP